MFAMKTFLKTFALCASVSLLGMTQVAAQDLKPGQYEYTTKTEVFGMSIPISFKQCVTAQDVASQKAYVNQQGMEDCTPPEVKRKGTEISIKYACSKPKMSGEGTGTVTDETFTMDMRVTQHEMGGNVIKTALAARRIGDCVK